MNTRTRCLAILDMLQKQHQVKVGELADTFNTSEMTIRRDLNFLTQQYNITRTHGGATLAQDSVVRMISFDEAKIEHKEAKELIARKAMELFRSNYRWERPLRSIGVRGADLVTADGSQQLDLFERDTAQAEVLERTVDRLRERFGAYCVRRCSLLEDERLTGFNPKDDHTSHPVSFFR